MKVPAEVVDSVVQGGIKEKWEYFKNLDDVSQKEMDLVKYGINIVFDIRYLFVDTSYILVKDKDGKVLIGNKPYSRNEYWDELDNREMIMVECIYRNIEQKTILEGRE